MFTHHNLSSARNHWLLAHAPGHRPAPLDPGPPSSWWDPRSHLSHYLTPKGIFGLLFYFLSWTYIHRRRAQEVINFQLPIILVQWLSLHATLISSLPSPITHPGPLHAPHPPQKNPLYHPVSRCYFATERTWFFKRCVHSLVNPVSQPYIQLTLAKSLLCIKW